MAFWHWIAAKLTGDEQEATAVTSPSRGTSGQERTGDSDATATAVIEASTPAPAQPENTWWNPPGDPLVDLAPIPRPDLSIEARAIENVLLLHFDGRNLDLPSLPHVPERVLQLMGKRDFKMTEVATEIGMDQVAAAAVLRVANSPLYCGVSAVTAIEPAVVRLGTRAIRTLMMSLSMRSIAFREKRKGNNFAETLWQRAMAGGHIMRSLSRFTHMEPEVASLVGLMHEVGSIIVLRIVNQQSTVAGVQLDSETFEYLCHEAHQEFGELLADAWKLPPALKTLISDHHQYPSPDDPLRMERLQLRLCDMICALLGYAPYAPYALLDSRAAQDLGLAQRDDFQAFLADLPAELDEAFAAAF